MPTLEIALEALKERIDGSILSEESRTLSKSEVSAIRKYTRRDIDEAEVYTFPCLAIDTTPTRNGVIYSAESQKATVKKWIGIPFLFNSQAQGAGIFANGQDHTVQAASQYGRIYKAQLVETGGGNVGTLVWVYSFPDVSPAVKEFVNKVDTGILREVSIHVLAQNGVECSICGESFNNPDHNHIPGEKYGKETCYIKTVGQLEPIELSSVACPGSVVAHIMDDSEVSKYKLLSLREALSGSHSPIEASMEATADETALIEASDAPADGGKADDDECDEKSKKEDDSEDMDESEEDAKDGDGKDGANDTGKKAGKQSFSLFEGADECPVCHRTEQAQSATVTDEIRDQVLAEYRSDIEKKILAITEAAAKKVEDAEARAEAAENASKDAEAMLEHFAGTTVDLAIEKGLKQSGDRDAYHQELCSLGFAGIKALLEVLNAAPSKKDEDRKALEESAKSNFRKHDSGRQDTTSKGSAGRFAAPIGPKSKRS